MVQISNGRDLKWLEIGELKWLGFEVDGDLKCVGIGK